MKTKNILFIIAALLTAFSCSSQTANNPEGSWMGLLPIDGTDKDIRIVFNIEKQDSIYKVVMHDPDNMSLNNEGTINVNDTIRIKIKNGYINFTGVLKNTTTIEGIYSQMGYNKNVELIKQTPPLMFNRPQTPVWENKYIQEIVYIPNPKAKGVKLNGIFSRPTEGSNFPVAILIAGSGPLDMDETIAEHKIFYVISDYLVKRGIAVLRYDKRGAGNSLGRFATATSEDFTSDAEAIIEYLKTRDDIDKSKIGLIGHSEGGEVSFIIGAMRKDISYIVSMAGPGISGRELADTQRQDFSAMQSMSDSVKNINKILVEKTGKIAETIPFDSIMKNMEKYALQIINEIPEMKNDDMTKFRIINSLYNIASPRMQFLLKYDPEENLKKINCPVFAINGEKDIQVNADRNLGRIDSLIKSNGNKDVTVKKYPNLNHMFQHCETGYMDEYAWIEETISPEVLDDISNWILEKTR